MNARTPRPVARMTLFLALLASVGGSDSPPPATSQQPDPLARRLCETLHTLPATRKGQCCGTTPSSLADACGQELSASLRRAAIALDAAAIDRCAAETSRRLEGCDWVTPLTPPLPDACRGLVRGRLEAGARCRSSLECLDGLTCRDVSPIKDGVCARPVAARSRCEVPADNLASYARATDDPRHPACDGLCVKGQCLPFTPAGGACASGAQCVRGLQCIAGRCQDRPLPKAGESCAGNTVCGIGASCQRGVCAALKGEGAPCTLPTECRSMACAMAPGAKTGTCGAPCGAPPPAPAR
jgi:hypothetical protein